MHWRRYKSSPGFGKTYVMEYAESIGTGLRKFAGSGYVYRADWATEKEGAEITVVFQFPW